MKRILRLPSLATTIASGTCRRALIWIPWVLLVALTGCATFQKHALPPVPGAHADGRLVWVDVLTEDIAAAASFYSRLFGWRARSDQNPDYYWRYQSILFRNQRDFAMAEDHGGLLLEYGEQLNLDMDEFRGCLNSDRHAQAISANIELTRSLGLPGTPAILVGSSQGMSRRLNSYDYRLVSEAIEEILNPGS